VKIVVPGYEWTAVSNPTDAAGEFNLFISNSPRPGHWEFFIVEGDRRVSEIVAFDSSDNCQTGKQFVYIEFVKNY